MRQETQPGEMILCPSVRLTTLPLGYCYTFVAKPILFPVKVDSQLTGLLSCKAGRLFAQAARRAHLTALATLNRGVH